MKFELEEAIRGSIAITNLQVENNKMGWDVIDFFKHALKSQYTGYIYSGWYARIEIDGIHRFLWCDSTTYYPSKKYLKALQDDGWKTI
jgi:hypothetical protein